MLIIRPATIEDKEAVLAFCRETFHWGDYIEDVYDRWLAEPDGELAVAVFDGRPVGISHVAYLSPTEAWFEGLRVDPEYRRHGVAKALTSYTRAACLARGITVGRAFIDGSNVASQSLSAKAGFRKAMEFRAYKRTAEPEKHEIHEEVRSVLPEDIKLVAEFMQGYAGRIMAWHWHAQEVSVAALDRALRDESLYLVKRDEMVVCVAAVTYWDDDKSLDIITYFCKDAGDAKPMVLHFINEQAEGRVGEFHMFETAEQSVLDLEDMGFEASEHGVSGLWEMRL